MTTLHPHWQTTDGDSRPDVSAPARDHIPVEPTGVSRRPAAVFGMLLVIGISLAFYQGIDNLRGQLAENPAIHLTESGPVPATLTVQVGDTISWINDVQDVPQIIQSETLCSEGTYCLRTRSLFAGESDTFTITQDIMPGTYAYSSMTSDTMNGTIVVEGTGNTESNFDSVDDVLIESLTGNTSETDTTSSFPDVNTTTTPPTVTSNPFTATANTESDPFEDFDVSTIPRNPYTVDSSRVHPFDAEGNPIETLFEGDGTTEAFMNGYGPISQPDTGAGIWVVAVLSIVSMWWVTRKYFSTEARI